MVQTINQRIAAKIEGDFVVFLIGARLNRWWKFLSFFPIARAMSRMVGETKPPVISTEPEAKPIRHPMLDLQTIERETRG